MPRASTKTKEEKVEKTTPRKRAAPKKTATKTKANKAAPKKTPVKKTPTRKTPVKRKTAAKKAVEKEEVLEAVLDEQVDSETDESEVVETTKKRKAPTVFAGEAAKKRAVRTQLIVAGILLVMGVGASAAVGFNDTEAGQINVEETIRAQNARMANMVDVEGPTVVAPNPSRATIPDNGFIPSADTTSGTPAPAPTTNATSTATSTDVTATSTTDGVPEGELDMQDTSNASAMDTATTTVTANDRSLQNEEVTVADSAELETE